MDSDGTDDHETKNRPTAVARLLLGCGAAVFGQAVLLYGVSRLLGGQFRLDYVVVPYGTVLGYFATIALVTGLGALRRRRGWSSPLDARWHIGATGESDAVLAVVLISVAGCLFIGQRFRHPVPLSFWVIYVAMMLLTPIRDKRGRCRASTFLVTAAAFALMVLPIRLLRLFGLVPQAIAAAIAIFLVAGFWLAIIVARKSEDLWRAKQGLTLESESKSS